MKEEEQKIALQGFSSLHYNSGRLKSTNIIIRGVTMSVQSTIQLATDAIDDAKKRLERARVDADDDYEIRQALKHLEDARDYLRKAANDLRQQG
jgi:hypothetical protein